MHVTGRAMVSDFPTRTLRVDAFLISRVTKSLSLQSSVIDHFGHLQNKLHDQPPLRTRRHTVLEVMDIQQDEPFSVQDPTASETPDQVLFLSRCLPCKRHRR